MVDYIVNNVKIIMNNGTYKAIATSDIPRDTVIMRTVNQYKCDNFNNNLLLKSIVVIHKMIIDDEKELFPRSDDVFVLGTQYVKLLDNGVKQILTNNNESHLFKNIRRTFKTIDRSTLVRFYAKLVFNAFMISEKNIGPVINITGARLNYSCNPNVNFVPKYDKTINDYVLEFRTNRIINAGEEIYDSYIQNQPPMCYVDRIEYLRQHYDFTCQCDKCYKNK